MDRDIPRIIAEMALEPIKAMVRNGAMHPHEALAFVGRELGHYSNHDYDPAYKKFVQNQDVIFEEEVHFPANYQTTTSFGYIYTESSHVDSHFLFQLHQQFNGPDYDSPEELKESLQDILKDKKLLEIGCGPGFGLKVFQDLGAEVTGVELRNKYKNRIPDLDIKYGNALNLSELVGDQKFDIIYSSDVFATACINHEDSSRIAYNMYEQTANNGKGFHFVTYTYFHPVFLDFSTWIQSLEMGALGPSHFNWFENLSPEQREDHSWSNTVSLDPQYLIRAGFNIKNYNKENGDLVILTQK